MQEIVYCWDCGVRIVRGREVQTARNCVLVGLWGRRIRRESEVHTARNCVLLGLWRENCKGEGSADCKKLCTGGIVGGEL